MNSQNPSRIRLSILMPVLNEGLNLRIMLKLLRSLVDVEHEVIVVYDHPEDDSLPIVEDVRKEYANLFAVQNNHGRGVVNAIRTGAEVSRGDYLLIFAADEVGPVLAIDDMLELMDAGCDMVSCTRYAWGGRRLGGSFTGGILSRLANSLFVRLAGSQFTDSTTGIKMFRRDIYTAMDINSRPVGWTVAFEMSIRAQQMCLQLGEIPIISIDRLFGGKSSFRLGPWAFEYMKWFIEGIRMLRKIPPAERPEIKIRIPKNIPK